MRLAWKLTLALWAGIITVLALGGWGQLRRDAELFRADMLRDHRTMGWGIAAGVAEVWASEGRERAVDIVRSANLKVRTVQIRWLDLGDTRSDARGALPEPARSSLAAGEPASWLDPEGGGRMYSYVPVQVAGRAVGTIELSESLAVEQAYLYNNLLRVISTTGTLALIAGVISMGIGAVVIGRPLRLLTAKARRVGQGDFSGDLRLDQRDELGQLAAEMNAMSRRLAQARAEIEAATAARLAALEQLRHAERVVTVGNLASGVAHELGTPLNVIAYRTRNIASGRVEGDNARENARIAHEQCERITRIVRQLLDYARRRTPETAVVDLAALAEQSASLLAPIARKSAVELEIISPVRPLRGRADGAQMQQVLTNLVLNGIQAMREGGRLTVALGRAERAPPPDVISASSSWLTVTIADTGPGISPEHLPLIFDPFFTTKGVGEGTGLGLSVAWGIVREHGGWIEAASAPGQGARFTVYLPDLPEEEG